MTQNASGTHLNRNPRLGRDQNQTPNVQQNLTSRASGYQSYFVLGRFRVTESQTQYPYRAVYSFS